MLYLRRPIFYLPLVLMLLATSCNPPIWSRMQRRADAERKAKAQLKSQVLLAHDTFGQSLVHWTAEAEGQLELRYLDKEACLDIKTDAGLSFWYNKPLEGNIRISYEIQAVDQGEQLDRVSDLNCYWMASDPFNPDSIMERSEFRKGAASRYYSLQLYSMSMGANENTTTFFQRFNGDYQTFRNEMKRPDILTQYSDDAHLILPNRWYRMDLMVQDGRVKVLRDGEILVDFQDPMPLKKGWFCIRTKENHLRLRAFSVFSL